MAFLIIIIYFFGVLHSNKFIRLCNFIRRNGPREERVNILTNFYDFIYLFFNFVKIILYIN